MKYCHIVVSIARPSTLQPTALPSDLVAAPRQYGRGRMSVAGEIVRSCLYGLEVDTVSLNFNKLSSWNFCKKTVYYSVYHGQPAIHPPLV